jgi:hypothetical protein
MIVNVTISRARPTHKHVNEQAVLSFQVIDRMGAGTARGDFPGHFAGAVRPLLMWETEFSPEKGRSPETA